MLRAIQQRKLQYGGPTIILMGDSNTARNGGVSIATPKQTIVASYDGKGFFTYANIMLRHAFTVIGNAGIGGDNTGGMLARFATDVLSYRPDWVCILGGTNNPVESAATRIANLQAMYELAEDNGIRVMALPIPPNLVETDEAELAEYLEINRWILDYARTHKNVTPIPGFGQAIHNPATTWHPVAGTMNDSGIHFDAGTAVLAGRQIYEVMKYKVGPGGYMLAQSSGDDTNFLLNPLMQGTGTSAPTSWTLVGTPTISYVDRTDGLPYKWCQAIVADDANNGFTQEVVLSEDLAVGDTVIASCEFECESLDTSPTANNQTIAFRIEAHNGATYFVNIQDGLWGTTYSNMRYPIENGVFETPAFTIPATTTKVRVYIVLRGGGTYRVGRARLTKVLA